MYIFFLFIYMYVRIYTHVSFTKIYKRESVYVYIYMCIYTYNVYIPIYSRFILEVVWKRVFYRYYLYVYIYIYLLYIYRTCTKCLIEIFCFISRKTRHTR